MDIDGNCYPVHPLKRLKITEAEFEKLAKEYFSSIHGLEGLPLSARCDSRLVINKNGKIVDIQLTRKVNKKINQLVKEFVKTTNDLWLSYIDKETEMLVSYIITISFNFRNGIGLNEVSF